MAKTMENNKTLKILADAEKGGYGVQATIVYNIEHILGVTRAAENKRSPLIILLFPWAITFSNGLLVRAAADAAKHASVPIAVHLDHCQNEAMVRHAADTLPFDSIMIDMSHHDRSLNLAKTRELVRYCHARGIAAEAEPGRIEGGEDGISGTEELEGLLTTEKDVEEFIGTGVDMLAPSFGNVHGEYGVGGPRLDFELLETINKQIAGRVKIVLHGTNSFPDELTRQCIKHGISKINVNKLILEKFNDNLARSAGTVALTELMEQGVECVRQVQEHQMDVCWSSGKAA